MLGTAVYPGWGTGIGGFVGGIGGAIGGEKFLGWLGGLIDEKGRSMNRRDLSMELEYTL
jgi:hypothetical protein